jgi:hypothetical protein
MDFGMHKRISIFRSKIEDTDLNRDSDMSFSTGENLKHIIDSIKPYADDCTIFLHGCEKMVHFRALLLDNFPKAIIRHCGVDLETL